jgi:hypothetical protein
MPRRTPLPHLRGVRVRLKRDIDTRGGAHFPKGAICTITFAHTNDFTLKMRNPDPLNIFGPRWLGVSGVKLWDFEWLTKDKQMPPDPNAKPKRARKAPETVEPEKTEEQLAAEDEDWVFGDD